MWTPYKKPKYSKQKEYASSSYLMKYAELCKSCGYPYGKHYGSNICPSPKREERYNVDPSYPTEFYTETLNVNTKVL